MKSKIEKWYKQGLWTEQMVYNAVAKSIITAEDFKAITGKDYE